MKTDLIIISYGLICEIGVFSFFTLEPGEKAKGKERLMAENKLRNVPMPREASDPQAPSRITLRAHDNLKRNGETQRRWGIKEFSFIVLLGQAPWHMNCCLFTLKRLWSQASLPLQLPKKRVWVQITGSG